MAVTGLTAFKCIQYKYNCWRSPTYGLDWNAPVVWADCIRCPKDNEGHIIISRTHSCGIYATLWDDELMSYMNDQNSVALLLEALGHEQLPKEERNPDNVTHAQVWQHTYGFTATGVLVVGVINLSKFGQEIRPFEYGDKPTMWLEKQQLAMKAASAHFKAPIMDYQTARILTQLSWEKNNAEWPSEIERL